MSAKAYLITLVIVSVIITIFAASTILPSESVNQYTGIVLYSEFSELQSNKDINITRWSWTGDSKVDFVMLAPKEFQVSEDLKDISNSYHTKMRMIWGVPIAVFLGAIVIFVLNMKRRES